MLGAVEDGDALLGRRDTFCALCGRGCEAAPDENPVGDVCCGVGFAVTAVRDEDEGGSDVAEGPATGAQSVWDGAGGGDTVVAAGGSALGLVVVAYWSTSRCFASRAARMASSFFFFSAMSIALAVPSFLFLFCPLEKCPLISFVLWFLPHVSRSRSGAHTTCLRGVHNWSGGGGRGGGGDTNSSARRVAQAQQEMGE